jgi:uracil phosphoribosyltransferase
MVHTLGAGQSIFNTFLSELRDVHIQKDSMRFRRNLERIGEVMAYEISKSFEYRAETIQTPLGESETKLPSDEIVIGTILRAGLPLHQGLLNYFDKAQNAFISAYRKHHKDDSFEIHIEYLSSPSIEGKTLILCDPMLATGQSMVLAYKAITERLGRPSKVHIAAVLASEAGLDYTKAHLGSQVSIWLGAIDPELNAKSYIIPGLGDAGDLAYGSKI